MQDKREIFIKRLKEDLIGPLKEDELLSFNPETTYLNGILYPSNECEPDEYDDETDPITRNEDTYDEIKKIWKMVKNAEFKRYQSAIGPKVSKMSFDKDRRFPITNKFSV